MIANPIPWPDDARCAVAMTWEMDADSAFNWYNKDSADNPVAAPSWTRYDPLIAISRLVHWFARLDQVCDHVEKLMAEGRWTPRYETFPLYQSPLSEFSKQR